MFCRGLQYALALSCLPLASFLAYAGKVIQLPLAKRNNTLTLAKRDPFAISMQNYIPGAEYYVTALIGNPPQDIELVLDTGSSDIWMFGPGSCNLTNSLCEGGVFDISSSRTAKYVSGQRGKFEIQYASKGSGVTGFYFTDDISVGGVQISNNIMAVATKTSYVPSGIMGIGLARDEASVGRSQWQYPNFPDMLVSQGKIRSRSYSLYLDNLGSSTGVMLFGGYDEEKFRGQLTMLPVQVDEVTGERSSFIVSWSSLGLEDTKGEYTILPGGTFLYPVLLDSGTTLTYMPSSIYATLAAYFQIVSLGPDKPDMIDCDFAEKHPGQLVYGFGGTDGVEVAVDFDELAVPLYNGTQRTLGKDGQPLCMFGIAEGGTDPILFGQTFLRSAYVLYDLDNLQVGLAQTVFDSKKSSVVEYDGLPAPCVHRIPGPQETVTAADAIQTGSGANIPSRADAVADTASKVSTHYTISTVSYPSETPPRSFPTSLPPGPTGRIRFSESKTEIHRGRCAVSQAWTLTSSSVMMSGVYFLIFLSCVVLL